MTEHGLDELLDDESEGGGLSDDETRLRSKTLLEDELLGPDDEDELLGSEDDDELLELDDEEDEDEDELLGSDDEDEEDDEEDDAMDGLPRCGCAYTQTTAPMHCVDHIAQGRFNAPGYPQPPTAASSLTWRGGLSSKIRIVADKKCLGRVGRVLMAM